MKGETLINTQFSVFLEGLIEKPEDIWQDMNASFGGIFVSPPLIIQVPQDPNLYEVPIVQLRSKNGIFVLNIARKRADFFIKGQGRDARFETVEEDLLNKSLLLFDKLDSFLSIQWIGFVSRFFIEEGEPKKIITNVLNPEFQKIYKGSAFETFTRYVSRMELLGYVVNNFTEIQQIRAKVVGYNDDVLGILITRDFNTRPEDNKEKKITGSFVKDFILESEKNFELEKIKEILWKQ